MPTRSRACAPAGKTSGRRVLIQNRDRVVSKDDLIASIWDGRIVSESTLTSRINAARKAVGDSGEDPISRNNQADLKDKSSVAQSVSVAWLPFMARVK